MAGVSSRCPCPRYDPLWPMHCEDGLHIEIVINALSRTTHKVWLDASRVTFRVPRARTTR